MRNRVQGQVLRLRLHDQRRCLRDDVVDNEGRPIVFPWLGHAPAPGGDADQETTNSGLTTCPAAPTWNQESGSRASSFEAAEIAEDPVRYLLLGADRAGRFLELVVMDRPQGPAVIHAMPMRAKYRTLLPKGR
jgi:hypothetical protein